MTEELRLNETYLNHSFTSTDFKYLTGSDGTIGQAKIDNFGIFREFDIIQNNEGTIYSGNCPVCCWGYKKWLKTANKYNRNLTDHNRNLQQKYLHIRGWKM